MLVISLMAAREAAQAARGREGRAASALPPRHRVPLFDARCARRLGRSERPVSAHVIGKLARWSPPG
jgi:hypothetical protein